jgi:hypothetical protein
LPDVGRVGIGNLSDGVVRVYVENVELYNVNQVLIYKNVEVAYILR